MPHHTRFPCLFASESAFSAALDQLAGSAAMFWVIGNAHSKRGGNNHPCDACSIDARSTFTDHVAARRALVAGRMMMNSSPMRQRPEEVTRVALEA